MTYTFDCDHCGQELEPSEIEMAEGKMFCDSCNRSNIIFSFKEEALKEIVVNLLEKIDSLEEKLKSLEKN